MKLTKRFLSGLLALSMVLAMCPVITFAADTATTETPVEPVELTLIEKGLPAGRDEDGSNIIYLSDLYNTGKLKEAVTGGTRVYLDQNYEKYLYVYNGSGTLRGVSANKAKDNDKDDSRYTVNNRSYVLADIALGYTGIKYGKGLGMLPYKIEGGDSYIVYSVDGLDVDRFYAVVGGTSHVLAHNNEKDVQATFELWGSKSESYTDEETSEVTAEFVKLAYATGIGQYRTAEFDVDITGYHYIKLVVRLIDNPNIAEGTAEITDNTGCAVAWGDACVYKSTENDAKYINITDRDVWNGLKAEKEDIIYLSSLHDTTNTLLENWMKEDGGVADQQGNTKINLNSTYNSGTLYFFQGGTRYPNTDTAYKDNEITVNGNTYSNTEIALGYNGVKFASALGVHPNAVGSPDRYIVYDVSDLGAERFYAIAGATASNITDPSSTARRVTFELWGSKCDVYSPASFEKLAYTDDIRAYNTAEFDINISGYNFIKLVVKMTDGSENNASCAVAWGNACVYNTTENTVIDANTDETGTIAGQQGGYPYGMPEGITRQWYLSDMSAAIADHLNSDIYLDEVYGASNCYYFIEGARKSGTGGKTDGTDPTVVDEKGYRTFTLSDGTTKTVYKSDITLGYYGTTYMKGLGVHPNYLGMEDRYIVYDVRGLNADYFYAVAGATGGNITNPETDERKVIFEVWGSKADNAEEAEYVRLAQAINVRAFLLAEFNVQITDYNFLKLVVKMDPSSTNNESCAVAWGNACVYTKDAAPIPEFTSGTDKGEKDAGGGNYQQTYTDVTQAQVTAYEKLLTDAGWTQHDIRTIPNPDTEDVNYFVTYVNEAYMMVHLNYFGGLDNGRFQIIYGPKHWTIPTEEISVGKEVCTPSVSIITHTDGNLGMVVQLADGSFVIIDGGYGGSGDHLNSEKYLMPGVTSETTYRDHRVDIANLLDFLDEMKPESHKKPQVYWMATHADGDHTGLPYITMWGKDSNEATGQTNERFDLKGIIYNFPNFENVGLDETKYDARSLNKLSYRRFVAKAKMYFPEAEHYIYQTGQVMDLSGASIEFLYTPGDLRPYDMVTANHTSGVWRFNFDNGYSFLVTGDAQQNVIATVDKTTFDDQITKTFGSYLKSDMLQIIHHGSNGGSLTFYEAVDPYIVFWPQRTYSFENDQRHLGIYGTVAGKDHTVTKRHYREYKEDGTWTVKTETVSTAVDGYNANVALEDGKFYFNYWIRNTQTTWNGQEVDRVHYTTDETHTIYLPTVSYDANGGTGTMESTGELLYGTSDAQQGTTPAAPQATVKENAFTNTDKEYYGWDVDGDGIVDYVAGEEITVTENVTLSAAWEDPAVQIPLVDESGELDGSVSSLNGKIGDIVGKIQYLSDMTPTLNLNGETYKNDLPYHGSTFPYFKPDTASRLQVSNTKTIENEDGTKETVDAFYPKRDANNNIITDADGNQVLHDQAGAREYVANGELVTYYYNKIHLGGYGTQYDKGVSIHPNKLDTPDRALVYETKGMDYFYAIVGGSGSNITNPNGAAYWADFEVWATASDDPADADTYILLAHADKVGDWYTAEFNVDVSDYKYVKLLVKMNEVSTSNSSCGVTWADACVYSIETGNMGKNAQASGLTGRDEHATNIKYLSDLHNGETITEKGIEHVVCDGTSTYVVDQNNSKVTLNEAYSKPTYFYVEGKRMDGLSPEVDETGNYYTYTLSDDTKATYHKNGINLGYNAIAFKKGLGVHPAAVGAADRYIVYDVSSLNANRFYAVVGATGAQISSTARNGRSVTFEVWGSKADPYDENTEFVKLSYINDIRAYMIGEFDVDITGYNYIKLVVRVFTETGLGTTNDSSAVAWGDACVYSVGDHDWDDGVCSTCNKVCEHSYSYSDNGNNTHDQVCEHCGHIAKDDEKHSYDENNACVCGHTLFTMRSGSSATLKAMLQLDFVINPEQLTGDDNYAILTRVYSSGDKAGQTETIRINQADWADYTGDRKTASYTNIAAKEMGDQITIILYNAQGQQLSVPRTDSIKDYAYRGLTALASTTKEENIQLRTMLADMLNYGAAAQLYFKYDTENLVNAAMTDVQKSWATEADPAISSNMDNGVGGRSRTLTLKSAIQLDFIFYAKTIGSESEWADLYAVATYTDHYGNEKTVTVKGEDFTCFSTTTDAQISVVGMAVADYQSMVTCVVYNSAGEEVGRSVDSIEGYSCRAIEKSSDEDLKVMLKALMKFGAAADTYFA